MQKCFATLGIAEDSGQDVARQAYLKLVKLVHPDSGRSEASAENFTEIDNAFKTLQAKFSKERRDVEEDDDDVDPIDEVTNFDIKVRKVTMPTQVFLSRKPKNKVINLIQKLVSLSQKPYMRNWFA